MLRIHNTLTGEDEVFEPLVSGEVRMYVCGPTVYTRAHIGHAMSYIVFDVVRRYLEYKGFHVTHVQNFTDVDDKIINRAQGLGEPWYELAERYAVEFLEDMAVLNVLPADQYPRATGVMCDIISDVQRLIDSGHAYVAGGDVYFRVLSDPDYGKLSHRKLTEMRAGARVEENESKEHPMDFALWKAAKPGEPSWDSPWGPGRPGWHIECTTMNLRTLGEQIDIHGGGEDLVFPHHENEIAQSEALTGRKPFARYWMHNGWLRMGGEKMSKSLGNVVSIEELVRRYGPDAVRVFVLSSHYRKPLNFTEEAVEAAARGAARLATAVEDLDEGVAPQESVYRDRFEAAMDDDFNTPAGLAVLFDLSKEINRLRAEGQSANELAALLRALAGVLGLALEASRSRSADVGPFVDLLLEVRQKLRGAKQYELADLVRQRLNDLGVTVEDKPEGTTWRLDR